MTLAAYIIVSVLVVIMGGGPPGLGDAALIAAARAGEGHLNIRIVLAAAMAAWILGSAAGYAIGWRQGRGLLEHPTVHIDREQDRGSYWEPNVWMRHVL